MPKCLQVSLIALWSVLWPCTVGITDVNILCTSSMSTADKELKFLNNSSYVTLGNAKKSYRNYTCNHALMHSIHLYTHAIMHSCTCTWGNRFAYCWLHLWWILPWSLWKIWRKFICNTHLRAIGETHALWRWWSHIWPSLFLFWWALPRKFKSRIEYPSKPFTSASGVTLSSPEGQRVTRIIN